MNTFPSEIQFQRTWRDYQARVLGELEEHLDDNRLHVVAAPGSGKTVLGLECMLRLDRPTLILSPTLAIRDQWIDRFVHLFIPDEQRPDWISTDILEPGLFTCATYQSLYSAMSGRPEPEEDEEEDDEEDDLSVVPREKEKSAPAAPVVQILRDAGVKTIIVDEAHHLRTNWWRSLTTLIRKMEDPTVVALTATPPYDVQPAEWERYKDLCGPVDAEVPVPELVRARNLCPHQDYVYFNHPSRGEAEQISEFRREVREAVAALCSNEAFADALGRHIWLGAPEGHLPDILDDPEYFSSIAVFLQCVRGAPPPGLLKAMGLDLDEIPKLTTVWLERLLTGCLFTHVDQHPDAEEAFDEVRRSFSRIGAIERRKVHLKATRRTRRLLVSSINKLQSIAEIVRLESDSLGDDLRMVVLTDFIRRSDLPRSADDIKPHTRIGIASIFETIRRERGEGVRLGALSGSLVIVPRSAEPALGELCEEAGIDAAQMRLRPLAHDEDYCILDAAGQEKKRVVRLITRLFTRGEITVLVGTKSLLGEGWDAPAINALILASFVGSYMLSNQMRGRAFRSQPGRPNKTANIWHLVCIEPGDEGPGEDYGTLTRRLQAFVGVSYTEDVIQNGTKRLGLGGVTFTRGKVEELNAATTARARDRDGLTEAWERALRRGDDAVRMVQEVRAPTALLPRAFIFQNTIRALLVEGLFSGIAAVCYALSSAGRGQGSREGLSVLILIAVACLMGAVVALPWCVKALWLTLKHGPVESSIAQIGEAVLRTLCRMKMVRTDLTKMLVAAERAGQGGVACWVEGGSSYEKSLCLDALQEALDPIDNPRYLLVRRSRLGAWNRQDWHAVPGVIGAKKESAEYFCSAWKRFVGPAELVYTRELEGRKKLLYARSHSLSAAFVERSERLNQWR